MAHLAIWTRRAAIASLCILLVIQYTNRPSAWRVAVIEDTTVSQELPIELAVGERHEISIEYFVDAKADLARVLASPEPQSLVSGAWSINCDEKKIAGGNSDDFLRITRVRSWRGKLYRVATRSPFGVSEGKYSSFGITGQFLHERVFGAFTVGEEATCTLTWEPLTSQSGVRVAVRRGGDQWASHSKRTGALAATAFFLLLTSAPTWLLLTAYSRRQGRQSQGSD